MVTDEKQKVIENNNIPEDKEEYKYSIHSERNSNVKD